MSERYLIDVEVDDQAWSAAVPGVEALVQRMGRLALQAAERAHFTEPGVAEVAASILLTDDETVRDLNSRFRNKDAATNVLSFPAHATARPHLGDIALAFGVCAREAEAQAKLLGHHLAHLVVHGVLHLVGYDHQADAGATVMEEMEREILRRVGVADPYAPPRDADVEL